MGSDHAYTSKSFISQAYHDTRIFEAAVNYTKADEITSVPEEREAIERDFPDLLDD